jgi:hypothetical protein
LQESFAVFAALVNKIDVMQILIDDDFNHAHQQSYIAARIVPQPDIGKAHQFDFARVGND